MSQPENRQPPYDWDQDMEDTYKMYINMEKKLPKQPWTFPSPFIAYAVDSDDPETRLGEICWGPQPRTVRVNALRAHCVCSRCLQLAELRMYALSWAIRNKPEWQRKMNDPIILEKWRKEALDQQEVLHINEKLTTNMVKTR